MVTNYALPTQSRGGARRDGPGELSLFGEYGGAPKAPVGLVAIDRGGNADGTLFLQGSSAGRTGCSTLPSLYLSESQRPSPPFSEYPDCPCFQIQMLQPDLAREPFLSIHSPDSSAALASPPAGPWPHCPHTRVRSRVSGMVFRELLSTQLHRPPSVKLFLALTSASVSVSCTYPYITIRARLHLQASGGRFLPLNGTLGRERL